MQSSDSLAGTPSAIIEEPPCGYVISPEQYTERNRKQLLGSIARNIRQGSLEGFDEGTGVAIGRRTTLVAAGACVVNWPAPGGR